MRQLTAWLQSLGILVLLAVFFMLLFYTDNKYQTPPPYGKSGVIALKEEDLERENPIFLIDGWTLTDEKVKNQPTYIGEFSNLQRGDLSASPHGRASYQLILRYEGGPRIVSVDFPQLSFQYAIFLDNKQLARGTGNGRITFLLKSGEHALRVETSSKLGYYSGMYFPPALGTAETLQRVDSIRNFAYALAFLLPLTLALFTIFLWRTGGNINRWFGFLCCFYALYMFRYFVQLFAMPAAQYWFLVQNLAFYGLCFSVVQLTVLACEFSGGKIWRWVRMVLFIWPLILFILCLLIPVFSWAVSLHGKLTDMYYVFTFCSAAFFASRGTEAESLEIRAMRAGCSVFGMGLIVNLFYSNFFEPIRFFWQFEWCGLYLVAVFGVMMVLRSRRVLRENDALTNHLEEQVKERTQEVTQLLEERKAFFSDMAHDLKAPVFATQSFIKAIRKSGVGVDMELQKYLDQAEAKQWEMARRLQGLSAINALDRIKEEPVRISLKEMLSEIYAAYHGEAEVRSVYFIVEEPEQDAFFMAQPEKLNILFENLIYNALKATDKNGNIQVSGRVENQKIYVDVKDSGCGIPKEELPFIFQRFFVGENNRATGTGLGLYIVQSIVEELGGTIEVWSVVGEGTRFRMEFPQDI